MTFVPSKFPLPCVFLFFLGAGVVESAVLVTVVESNGNVEASGGGTVNTTALSLIPATVTGGNIQPVFAALVMGAGVGDGYQGISGPSNFGTGGFVQADTTGGDVFGLNGAGGLLVLPQGYASGGDLGALTVWENTSFSELGLVPGSYTWTWGTGAAADSFTLNVTTVPEPGSVALLAGSLFALSLRRSRK